MSTPSSSLPGIGVPAPRAMPGYELYYAEDAFSRLYRLAPALASDSEVRKLFGRAIQVFVLQAWGERVQEDCRTLWGGHEGLPRKAAVYQLPLGAHDQVWQNIRDLIGRMRYEGALACKEAIHFSKSRPASERQPTDSRYARKMLNLQYHEGD